MTTMRTAPRTRARGAFPAARRVVVGAVGLVLLTATVLAGLHVAPRAAGTAHPGTANPADSRSAPAPDDPALLPDDPRLRDDRVDPFDDTHPAIAGLRTG